MIIYEAAKALESSPSGVIASEDHFYDAELLNIRNALKNSGHRELQRIDIDFSRREITLRGAVSTFFLKQVAQEAIRPLVHGRKIRNQLVVNHDQLRC